MKLNMTMTFRAILLHNASLFLNQMALNQSFAPIPRDTLSFLFLLQYASKRYSWSLTNAGFLLPLRFFVNPILIISPNVAFHYFGANDLLICHFCALASHCCWSCHHHNLAYAYATKY